MMKEMMGMPSMSGLQGSQPSMSRNRVQELDNDSDDELEQIQKLSKEMESELRGTGALNLNPAKGKGKQAVTDGKSTGKEAGADEGEINLEDEDIDINLAKNLLESLQGQAGSAGPAGNMLSMMNLRMPKDDRGR